MFGKIKFLGVRWKSRRSNSKIPDELLEQFTVPLFEGPEQYKYTPEESFLLKYKIKEFKNKQIKMSELFQDIAFAEVDITKEDTAIPDQVVESFSQPLFNQLEKDKEELTLFQKHRLYERYIFEEHFPKRKTPYQKFEPLIRRTKAEAQLFEMMESSLDKEKK